MKNEINRAMRMLRSGKLLIISVGLFLSFQACEKKQDYSNIVFKNYLGYEINRASDFLQTTSEGSNEGEYHTGSKQAYQSSIDESALVYNDYESPQLAVDQAYQDLLQAGEDFYDQMVPFGTGFLDLLYYAEVTLNNTQEGDQEGNVKPGNKQILQNAISEGNQTVSRSDLTQRLLDDETLRLNDAIYNFFREIVGKGLVFVQNPGFENPGYPTDDFNLVEGWKVFGIRENWAPLAEVDSAGTVPEGQFVARIGSYTQGIYQQLVERIQPNATYELNYKVAILSNNADWQGKRHKVIILSRIVTFGQEPGNYDYAEVISESYDTLGLDPGEYVELKQNFIIGAASSLEGKKIAIDFLQRHTWDKDNPIWAESFVGVDNVRLYRKLN